METKRCGKCKEELPITSFGMDASTASGLKNNCKECRKSYAASYYESNRDQLLAQTSSYQRANPERNRAKAKRWREQSPKAQAAMAEHRYRRRMAERGVRVVEKVDILILGERDGWICQLCFKPVNPDLNGRTSQSRSIDHIKPVSLGGEHSYENTQLAHFGCNARKRAQYQQ